MTADTVTTFITQNGAFGVLVVLIGAFCWWGIPWVVKQQERFESRLDAKDANHKAEIEALEARLDAKGVAHRADVDALTSKFTDAVNRNTQVIGELRTDIQSNTRATEGLAGRVGQLERVLDHRPG